MKIIPDSFNLLHREGARVDSGGNMCSLEEGANVTPPEEIKPKQLLECGGEVSGTDVERKRLQKQNY